MLCIKTPERAHLPNQWWERLELDKNKEKALQQIDENLPWWDTKHVKRCKRRFERLRQVLRRMRKLRNSNA